MKVRFQKTLIFPTDFNDFIKLWGEFGVDLGLLWDVFWHMRATWGTLLLHFGVTLGPLWAYGRRMAGMMCIFAGLMVSLSAPNGSINRKYTFLQRFCLSKKPGASHPCKERAEPEVNFGI